MRRPQTRISATSQLHAGAVLFRRSVTDPAGATEGVLALIEEHGDALYGLRTVIMPAPGRVQPRPKRKIEQGGGDMGIRPALAILVLPIINR